MGPLFFSGGMVEVEIGIREVVDFNDMGRDRGRRTEEESSRRLFVGSWWNDILEYYPILSQCIYSISPSSAASTAVVMVNFHSEF